MLRRIAAILLAFAFILSAGIAPRLHAQNDPDQVDPLTPDEIQQIRDSKIYPNDRIKLYLKFIDQRIDTLRQLASNPTADNRAAQIRNKLQEFTSLSDELQDNLDTYDSAHADIRKSLKDAVSDTSRWPLVLQSLPHNADYDFSVKTALDSAQSASDDAKQLAQEQDIFFRAHKNERNKNGTGPG
jgi:hypothetical protein